MRVISGLAENQLAAQEALCSMEWVSGLLCYVIGLLQHILCMYIPRIFS